MSRTLGNPRRWSLVDKSIVLAAITLPFRLSNVLMSLRVRSMPKAYSMLDPAALAVWQCVMVSIAGWWCAMIGTGIAIRKRHPDSVAFAYTVTLTFWITNCTASYAVGLITGPFWVSTVGAGFLSLILFGPRFTFVGLLSSLATVSTIVALERSRVIAYAPLLRESPLQADGHPVNEWFYYMGGTSLLVTVVVLILGYYLVSQWENYERRLEVLSSTDELTGLTNRRRFMNVFDRTLRDAQSARLPLSLLLIDVDHFKTVNDTHGHGVGDAVLVEVAARLRRCVRAEDMVSRHGGEEFCVLLPATPLEGAHVVAERCRAALDNRPVEAGGLRVPVTITTGVASRIESTRDSVDALLKAADQALYQGKTLGRNQVLSADAPTVPEPNNTAT